MSDTAASTTTFQRYLAWGQVATGASLVAARLAHVLDGPPWFDATLLAIGVALVLLGGAALAAGPDLRARLARASRHLEPALLGGLIAAGPDEDTGYVLALALILLMLAGLRGWAAYRVSMVVVVAAEAVRQALHPLVGDPVELEESLVGLGLAIAVSAILARLMELVRQSEAEAHRSASATAAALAEAERAAAQLDVMHRVVVSTIGSDETRALDRIVAEIASYLDVPAATVVLTDAHGSPRIGATSDPVVTETHRISPVPAAPFLDGVLGRAFEGRAARASADELDAMAATGLPRRGDVTVHPLRRANGAVVGALACATPPGRVFTDTEVRTIARFADQASLAIEAARSLDREADLAAQYRELDRLKTDFVAITSHELRTPLTTVVGAIATMRHRLDDLDRDELGRLVDALARQADRLTRLVDDLRTVSHMDGGTLRTLPRPTDVATVVTEAIAGLPDVDADLRVGESVPKAMADPDRLLQVVTNLLVNGDQHGAGLVVAEVAVRDTDVVVQVWDDGPGVPPDRREDVFDRFVRLGDTDSHTRGTGLGLAIARELTEAMGGSIAVVDRGTRTAFELHLPVAVDPA